MEEIRWGIIGCGDVCERKSGPAFYKIDHSSLVAVMRRDEEKAKDFSVRHQVANYYTDATELIHDPEVNAVYIATPPDTHRKYAIEAMLAGKPVYVEKPMALTYEECQEMQKISEATGQKLFEAFYRRGMDYFLEIKELVDKGAIGDIQTVTIRYYRPPLDTDINPALHTWRVNKEIAGGGYFYDLAPHTLDILDYIVGEISDVKSFTTNLGGLYDVEDTLSVALQFRSGALGTGIWCFVSHPSQTRDLVDITGSKGSIRFNTFAFDPIFVQTSDVEALYPIKPPEHVEMPLIQTIVDELRGVGKCPSTGETALRTAWVLEKCLKGN